MKKRVSESNMGVDYIATIISECEKAGVQCIVDDIKSLVLLYDPKKGVWASSTWLKSIDVDIFDAISDRSTYGQAWLSVRDPEFMEFADDWGRLYSEIAKGSDDVFASSNCEPIKANESTKLVKLTKEVLLDAIPVDSRDGLVDVNEPDGSFGKYTWYIRYAPFSEEEAKEAAAGITKATGRRTTYTTGRDVYVLVMDYPRATNESAYLDDFKPIDSAYLDDGDPDFQLDDEWSNDPDNYEYQDRMERARKRAKEQGKKVCWRCGDVFDPKKGGGKTRSGDDFCPGCAKDLGDRIVTRFTEGYDDDPRDWSASEGEVEIVWTTHQYEEFGIFEGDTSVYVIDYDRVDDHDDLLVEVCRLIGKEYPDLDFEVDDFEITNEKEFWRNRGGLVNESSNEPIKVKVEIEFVDDCYEIQKGQHYILPLTAKDVKELKDDCVNVDELEWYIESRYFGKYAVENKWITEEHGRWLHPNDMKIVNIDEVANLILGDSPEIDFANMEPDDVPDMSLDEALTFYHKMDNAYDEHELDYKKFRSIREKIVDSVVNELLKGSTVEELAKDWFVDYGTANGWGWKTSLKYSIASKLHQIHQKKHPDEHKPVPARHHWTGWHEDNCSCGLCSSSDSSD